MRDGEVNTVDIVDTDEDAGLVALTHLIDIEGVTLRYGIEGQLTEGQSTTLGLVGVNSLDGDQFAGRACMQMRQRK